MATLLSVDYDFFIPHGMYEDAIYVPAAKDTWPGDMVFDWQMGEGRSLALDQVIWETRYENFKRWGLDIVEMTKPKLAVEDFSIELSCMCGGASVPAFHADSHAWGAVVVRDFSQSYGEPFNVVNFDAHHDLGYEKNYKVIGEEVICENWALQGLQADTIANYTLVYPDWLGTVEMSPVRLKLLKPVADRITITTWSEWLKGTEIDDLEASFFCRSSAWCPPWLDPGFQTLLDEQGYAECLDCRYGQMCSPHNSCKPRDWDWEAVERYVAERDESMKLLTGHISIGSLEPS